MIVPTIRLSRQENHATFGTFGILKLCGSVFCVTLEPPNILNKKNISCIPALQYTCKRVISPTYGETFEITQVPDRDAVLFHPGNFRKDTQACVLLASSFGKLGNNRAILNSGATFKAFMEELKGIEQFQLTITEDF